MFIREQLREYEEARKKGLSEWGKKWLEKFNEGRRKHGWDVFSANRELAEEGLRFRLMQLDALSDLYKPIYSAFFYATIGATLLTMRGTLNSILKQRDELHLDKATQDYVNDLAERMDAIENTHAQEANVPTVPKAQFDALVDKVAVMERQIADLQIMLSPAPVQEAPSNDSPIANPPDMEKQE